ncbi:MAG: NAD-glutamate dehydrogenase [bacterium]|nr:NAD-glutamate dehydrogenase [bacterium]
MNGSQDASGSYKQELHFLLLRGFESALSVRELRVRSDGSLHEMAEDAASFAESLCPGQIKVRVSAPGGRRQGRSVVEVLVADQPFLVDTIRLALERLGLREKLLLHPLLAVERDEDGSIARCGRTDVTQTRESFVYAELPLIDDQARREVLRSELEEVISEARSVVSDHQSMLERLRHHVTDIQAISDHVEGGAERTANIAAFLEWLGRDNFVFFGYRSYHARRQQDSWQVELDEDSGLGVLRSGEGSRFANVTSGDTLPVLVRTRLADPRFVFLDKARTESRIHRNGRLDSVSIKIFDDQGQVTGFARFVGLLTHLAIRTRPSQVPLLEQRRQRVLENIEAEPGSHTYKAATEAFDALPIEFLFPADIADTTRAVRRILNSADHRQVETLVVPDPLNSSFFVSVILPRPLYDEHLRIELESLMTESYGAGFVDHRSSFLDDEVALIHFFCTCPEDVDLELLEGLEGEAASRVTSWEERFEQALFEMHEASESRRLIQSYCEALPEEYRAATHPSEAARDIDCLERVSHTGVADLRMEWHEAEGDSERYRLKLFQNDRPYLTDLLPVLDHLDLRAIDASLTPIPCADGSTRWIVTFRLEGLGVEEEDRLDAEARVLDGLCTVFRGQVENDALNRLILSVGLDWQLIDMLRAYLAFAAQLGLGPTKKYAAQVLARYPKATRALAELFVTRFDPSFGDSRDAGFQHWDEELERERGEIGTAAEDGVFSLLSMLVHATARHSFYQECEADQVHELAFKIDSSQIDSMPRPRPFAEIFVHSTEFFGVHLRGGRVARGGLRWSDRLHDVRTEVLGLMKTQMVKNGLIVPVGSKGGFALRRSFDDPAEARAHADRQYRRFTRRLLLLTDNIVAGEARGPDNVVRHDGDDPYLVVAADKGTAHLSDVANGVAEELDFWLGDAFASGGSSGYDHKVEGITAWGAWICAQRHFLEMETDVEKETFTVAGVGDMSGDVFGNGLLFARRGKLQAAFNHMHIFLDPDPDPETSWAERKRLFELPRSTWQDYDSGLISAGGGIYSRNARSIELSPEVRQVLDVSDEHMSGDELIRAILKMPVDLLWNGGIGTYVKASAESDADVGDRANENVRINACELRARVVGEGGNLGFTQLARVEYASCGGRVNTDAIDNSGGVDLSDHEVNFKILVARSCGEGRMSLEERNEILSSCVKDADRVVLEHSLWQSRCLSMDQVRSWRDPERIALASDFLVENADLDLAIEFLPDRDTMRTRATQSRTRAAYTRPELAVLLGYTKMLSKRALVASEVPDREILTRTFYEYFPGKLREHMGEEVDAHPLRREITATVLTNRVIDRAGVTLIPELVRSLSVDPAEVIAAYHLADTILGAEPLREQIEALQLPEGLRLRAWLRLEEAMRLATTVCLGLERRDLLKQENLPQWVEHTRELLGLVPDCLSTSDATLLESKSDSLVQRGLEAGLAHSIEVLPGVVRCFEAVSLAMQSGADLQETVQLHSHVGEITRISWLLEHLTGIDLGDGWTRMCAEALYLEMLETQSGLTAGLIDGGEPAAFEQSIQGRLRQIEDAISLIEAEGCALAPLVVLSQQIRRLC